MTRSFRLPSWLLGEPGVGRKIRLSIGALAVFDLLFYLFAIGPLADSDRERAMLVNNLRRQVEGRTAEVNKLAAIVEKVEKARTDGDQMLSDVALPRRTAYSMIVSELDGAGRQAGIELRERSYDIEPIEGSDTLSLMTVNVALEGPYENLVKFLGLLDRSPRFMIIENLGASPQQAGNRLNASLKLDAFVQEGGSAAPGSPSEGL